VLLLLHTYKVCQLNNWIDVIVQQLAALESLIMDCMSQQSCISHWDSVFVAVQCFAFLKNGYKLL
jgi:hypothetical protein